MQLKLDVSIQLMSPASGDISQEFNELFGINRFHSINVPSEWGPTDTQNSGAPLPEVSIQLMSPASGD